MGEPAAIRARLRERREAARAWGGGQRSGRANVGGAEYLLGEEGGHEGRGHEYLHALACWLNGSR